MRILLVQSGFATGGVAVRCLDHTRALIARGVRVDVLALNVGVCDSPWIREAVEAAGARVLAMPRKGKRLGLSDPRSTGWIRELMVGRQYDAVHAVVNNTSGPIVKVARAVGVPTRVAHYRVAELEYTSLVRRWRATYWKRLTLRHATHIVGVSKAVLNAIFPQAQARTGARLMVIPNGLAEHHFQCADPSVMQKNPGGGPVVGFVGRLCDQKMPWAYVEALSLIRKQVASTLGVMVGDGPLRTSVEEQIRGLGLDDAVTLVGAVPDVRPYYAGMDVLLFPTAFEGLPGVVLEAQAQGVPIVALDAPGVAEALAPGQSLVPSGDVVAMAEAALDLLASQGRRRGVGDAAKDWTRQHFHMDQIIQEWLRVYGGEEVC